MKTRPEMTDDEIRSHMDFDRLLEMHKKTSVHRDFFKSRYLLIAGFLGLGIFSWIMFSVQNNRVEQPQGSNAVDLKKQLSGGKERMASDSTSSQISPEISEKQTTHTERASQKEVQKTEPEKKAEETFVGDSLIENTNVVIQDREKPPVNLIYVQAVPVNGYPDLYEYFNRELKYPQEAIKDSINGEVITVFTINADGRAEKIVIENSLGPLFDKEVVRLIGNMPPWKPATYNSKPVASKMSLPLTFQIKKITPKK